ncbi:MAG: response regulator transcription factor [Pseudomonadota bacterium]|nr:response regulator transcription factor [Pseudomonadota bacterium]
MRIAFLEDEAEHAERITSLLQGAGHHVHVFERGRPLLANLRTETYEFIILDWEVPDVSGYDVARAIRSQLKLRTPILFLTHRDTETDIVQALQAGADDFLSKPARPLELLARLQALSRRAHASPATPENFDVPPFHVNLCERVIERDGQRLELTRREFEVALLLFQNLGTVLSRAHIMESIWGRGDVTSTRTVDMHISRVRQVLGLSAALGLRLVSIYGYGYRLERIGSGQQ